MRAQARDLAAREAKLDALHQKLTQSVEALVTGEDWKRALEFAARFRSRSFNNTMLIYVQHYAAFGQGRVPEPMPTYVAGFRQWLSLNRQVRKGQSGYAILAPVTARFASSNPADPASWRRLGRGEKPAHGEAVRSKLVGLKPAHVWDISQTDGDPVPETPRPTLLQGQAPEGLWDGLADQLTAHGFELRLVSNAAAIGGANGLTDFMTREVSVRMDMDDAAQVKTLAHELGHVILHGPNRPGATADAAMHRGIAEVEAESVALMVAAAHGLATDDYTVPYVASWASNVPGRSPVEVVGSTAERVRGTAVMVLDKLETPQIGDGNPPGLDRDALAAGQSRTRAHAPANEPAHEPAQTPANAQVQQAVGVLGQ
jgi:antirestriction protein ArdC